jgi:Zn-dependent protease
MPKKADATSGRREKENRRLLEKNFWAFYEEIYNVIVAIFVSTLILSYNFQNPMKTFSEIPGALAAVAIAVLLPIAAQKIMARRLGCTAFYKLWLPGLVVSMLLMLVGIKPIILVGSVAISAYEFGRWGMKSKYMSMTEIGWIGITGPLVNITLAIVLDFMTPFSYLAFVNALIALFNLVPIKPLDGSKVVLWNPMLWILLIIILALILTPSGILPYLASINGI